MKNGFLAPLGVGRTKVLQRIARFVREELLLLLLLAFCLAVRLIGLKGYELNGDNNQKWEFVRALVEGGQLRWNHHTTRWGILLPGLVARVLFGKAPIAPFVPPLAASLLQVACLYKAGALLHSRAAGVIAAVTLVMVPMWQFSGAQLMPSGFSAAYLALTVYLLLKYFDDNSGKPRYAVAAGVALFVAYLGKEANVVAGPGILLAVWLAHRNLKHVGLFCAVIGGLFVVETALYALFVEQLPLGRYSSVHVHHMHSRKLVPVHGFWGLFKRYRVLGDPWHFFFYTFVTAGAGVLVCYRKLNRGLWLTTIVATSFYLCMGIAVKSLHPITPVQTFQERYFADAAPLMLLVIVCGILELPRLATSVALPGTRPVDAAPSPSQSRVATSWWRRPLERFARDRLLAFTAVVSVVLVAYTLEFRAASVHPLTRLAELQEEVRRAYLNGDPIVSYDSAGKALAATRHVFWPFPIGEKPREGLYSARLRRNVDFVTQQHLPTKQAQQKYLERYRKRRVLTVIVGKRNVLDFEYRRLE